MMKKLLLSVLCIVFTLSPKEYTSLDIEAIIEALWEAVNGYQISDKEKKKICDLAGSHASVYGEATYAALLELINVLQLTDEAVFYDLGSGTGKVVAQFYLQTPVKKAVGIELSETRYKVAQDRVLKIQEIVRVNERNKQEISSIVQKDEPKGTQSKKSSKKKSLKVKYPERILEFRNEDILTADISDATIVFTCSTCFSEEVMKNLTEKLAQLKEGLRVLTLKQLTPHVDFKLVKTYTLPMTWSKTSPVYLYVLDRTKPEVSCQSKLSFGEAQAAA